ncbi:MAG TPA: ABC transporter substrate-binding protein [Longimicrobiaceae bacterium]|nr:ABC transporter substrate-binding protein [Longimicrobiaceae bacterium]
MMRNQSSGWAGARRALAVVVAGLAAACGGDQGAGKTAAGADGSDAQPDSGGTAVLAELADISKPMPLIFDTALDGDMMDMMYMALTRGAWRDGKIVYLTSNDSPMALAYHYEYVGPDSAGLRYYMRSGLKWSDGQPITAQDVVWTYDVIRDPKLASPRQDYLAHLDSVTAQNDSVVTFWFKQRYPEMLYHSGLNIAPKHVYGSMDPGAIRTHPALLNPAGKLVVSGSYMIGQWFKGDRIVFVRNPYFRVPGRLDQIVIRIIPEATTRLTELMTGGVDFTRPISFDQIAHVKAQAPNVRFEREQQRNYDFIQYNPRGFDAFADPEIREALGMAIDVKGIIPALQMNGYAVPAGGPYSPIFKELYDPATMGPLPYDTARARAILAGKGWKDSDGDGVLDKGGKPFSFELLLNSGNPRRADASQIIQQQWKRIGVDAHLAVQEFNTYNDRLTRKEYQAAAAGWSVSLSPALDELWSKNSPFNRVWYDDPQTFALFEKALAQPTEELANPLWKQAAARIVSLHPYTWLWYWDSVDGVNNRLKGMKVDTYGAYQNTWEWWIPKSQQRRPQAGAAAAPAKS